MQARILHLFRIPITPRKEKKVKLSDYSEKAIAKRQQRQQKKAEKKKLKKQAQKEQKQEKKRQKKEHPEKFRNERTLTENLRLITDVVGVLLRRFFRHLRIDLSRIHISVATGDAAKTAILYGVVCQSVAYLLEIMEQVKTLSGPDHNDVSVSADWLGESTKVDIKLAFSIRLWQLLDIGLRVLWRFIKHLFQDMKQKQSPHSPPAPSSPSKKSPNRVMVAKQNSK